MSRGRGVRTSSATRERRLELHARRSTIPPAPAPAPGDEEAGAAAAAPAIEPAEQPRPPPDVSAETAAPLAASDPPAALVREPEPVPEPQPEPEPEPEPKPELERAREGEAGLEDAADASGDQSLGHAIDPIDPVLAAAARARRARAARIVKIAVVACSLLCLAAAARVAMVARDARAREAAQTARPAPPIVTAPVASAAQPPPIAPSAAPITKDSEWPDATAAKNAAIAALDKRKVDEAIIAASAATALDPADGEAWLVLGAAYQDKGKTGEAMKAYRTCTVQGRVDPRGECAKMLRNFGGR